MGSKIFDRPSARATSEDGQVSQPSGKMGSVVETRVTADAGVEAGERLDEAAAPARPRRAWPVDAKEAAATRRARCWALVLMAGSGAVTIVVIAGAWLLARH
jgi:hypothetical protein